MTVALVHDWLTGTRGGERVLEALCTLYPAAEIFTLVHIRGTVPAIIEQRPVHRSFIQHLPFAARFYRHYLPLFPLAIEQFDLDRFDLVISSSHCAAKAVIRSGRARHLCYCHSPMRYAWDQFDAYFGPARVGKVQSFGYGRVMAALARWDAATASRVDRFLANSQYVAGRIGRYYNRSATVVYPPVDTDFFRPDSTAPSPYFLVVSALVPYKRLEIAIEACALVRTPLKIVGRGPESPRLGRMAGQDVEFLGERTREEIRDLYRGATAVLLPGEEDFGMVPVEAQACGRPVVALARGGALETVEDGVSGVLVADLSPQAFADGLHRVRQQRFDPALLRARAQRFSPDRFLSAIQSRVAETVAAPDGTRW